MPAVCCVLCAVCRAWCVVCSSFPCPRTGMLNQLANAFGWMWTNTKSAHQSVSVCAHASMHACTPAYTPACTHAHALPDHTRRRTWKRGGRQGRGRSQKNGLCPRFLSENPRRHPADVSCRLTVMLLALSADAATSRDAVNNPTPYNADRCSHRCRPGLLPEPSLWASSWQPHPVESLSSS